MKQQQGELVAQRNVRPKSASRSALAARSKQHKIGNPSVAAVFSTYPPVVRARLLLLRQLILEVAATTHGVGELEETLKWGQPSYLTTQTKSGSLIRIDQIKFKPDQYGMFFHCQTNLVETFRDLFRNELKFEANRCILLDVNESVPIRQLRQCISLALTYHRNKRR